MYKKKKGSVINAELVPDIDDRAFFSGVIVVEESASK